MTFKTGGKPQGSEIMLVSQKEKPLISVPGSVFTTSPMRAACDEEADSACERTELWHLTHVGQQSNPMGDFTGKCMGQVNPPFSPEKLIDFEKSQG